MIKQVIFRVRKNANLSRCKLVNGVLTSDNIKAPRTLYLTKKHWVDEDYVEQVDSCFYEFKHKKFGEFTVHESELKIIERLI